MKKYDFAFIVHSRNRSDLPRRFPFLRLLPRVVFDFLTLALPPFVVSRISGLNDASGKVMSGIVIGVPMTAHQLLEKRSLAVKKIIQSVKLAKSKGSRYVGLGAMTASLTRGGRDVIDQSDGIYVTTGRTYTIKNIVGYIDYCVHRFGLDLRRVKVGIVGAAGGIGSGVAIALSRKGYKNFLLIDLERKLKHLENHIETLNNHGSELKIELSHRVGSVDTCDIIVAATSSPEIVITSQDVNPGTIIINDAQPSDVSPEIVRNRSDVLVIEGGVLHAPGMNCHFNFGLAHKDDVFSCLAETLLLAHLGVSNHSSIDGFDPNLYESLEKTGNELGYRACLQNDMGIVSEEYMVEFAKIVMQRQNSRN